MNCAAALEAMLDAEPSELAGQSTTSLATHLASCARCRAVARRLDADTHLLAVSNVPSVSPGRMRRGATIWVQWSLVPVGLVAALFLSIARRTPDVPVGTTSATPAVAARDSVALPRGIADAATSSAERPKLTRVRAYPAAVPVAAVRISPRSPTFAPTPAEGGSAVIVDPQPGQRVAVMRTSNPKLTVVWLY
jgi:hypothetical protein